MLIRKLKELHKNKKGFSLVEAIAVVAIMGILSVIIASLLTSSTKYYSKNADEVAAKEISKILEKEIARVIAPATMIHLQKGTTESDLPRDETLYVHIEFKDYFISETTYNAWKNSEEESVRAQCDDFERSDGNTYTNSPFGDNASKVRTFSSKGDENYLMYSSVTGEASTAYYKEYSGGTFTNANTFYGRYYVSVYFKAIRNGSGLLQSVIVFADVYDTDDLNITYGDSSLDTDYESKNVSKHRVFTSSGRVVTPVKMISDKDRVFAYSQTEVVVNGTEIAYTNLLNSKAGINDRYTYLHYIVEKVND